MRAKRLLASLLAVAMAYYPLLALTAGNAPLGKVVPLGPAELNGTRFTLETTIFSGDQLATPPEGLALVLLPQGDQLHLGPASEVRVTQSENALVATLERGAVLARSGNAQTISVRARGLVVSPQAPTRYEVVVAENVVAVATEENPVRVQALNQTFTVPAGKMMRFEVSPAPQAPAGAGAGAAGIGPGVAAAIAIAISVGVAVPVSWAIADNLADKARREGRREGCILAIQSLSPTAPTSQCQ